MHPSQKALQGLRLELARVAEQIRRMQPNTAEVRGLEQQRLELVDELYQQEHQVQQAHQRRDEQFH